MLSYFPPIKNFKAVNVCLLSFSFQVPLLFILPFSFHSGTSFWSKTDWHQGVPKGDQLVLKSQQSSGATFARQKNETVLSSFETL